MDKNPNNAPNGEGNAHIDTAARQVVSSISESVRNKYGLIDLGKVPDHVNYSKVEKYLRSVNVEITRRMFFSYLNEALLPGGHEVKNSNFSYYTRDQIISYILIDMFKAILPLNKVKILINDILRPMVDRMGIDATYATLSEMIVYMVTKFEDAVTAALREEELGLHGAFTKIPNDGEAAQYDVAYYTNLVTLCMAKGALDFYKFSPNALLE